MAIVNLGVDKKISVYWEHLAFWNITTLMSKTDGHSWREGSRSKKIEINRYAIEDSRHSGNRRRETATIANHRQSASRFDGAFCLKKKKRQLEVDNYRYIAIIKEKRVNFTGSRADRGKERGGDERSRIAGAREKEISLVAWISLTDGHSWIHEWRASRRLARLNLRSRASSDPQILYPDWPVTSPVKIGTREKVLVAINA